MHTPTRLLALLAIVLLAAPASFAQAEKEAAYVPAGLDDPLNLSTPEETVRSMFRAMYLGDATLVDKVFLPDAQLRRVTNTGEIRPDGLQAWRDWVGAQSPGDAVEEIFEIEVQATGRLASVWAPFVVTYKGAVVGCGVNEFVLAKAEGDWRIVFAMDNAAPEGTDCTTFKTDYTKD